MRTDVIGATALLLAACSDAEPGRRLDAEAGTDADSAIDARDDASNDADGDAPGDADVSFDAAIDADVVVDADAASDDADADAAPPADAACPHTFASGVASFSSFTCSEAAAIDRVPSTFAGLAGSVPASMHNGMYDSCIEYSVVPQRLVSVVEVLASTATVPCATSFMSGSTADLVVVYYSASGGPMFAGGTAVTSDVAAVYPIRVDAIVRSVVLCKSAGPRDVAIHEIELVECGG